MPVPFDLNSYSVLLLPAFIQGLLFIILLGYRYAREGYLHDLLLSVLLSLLVIRLSFWMLGFAGWYDSHNGFTSFMFYFPFNTLALIGPCLYFYFLSLTKTDFKFTRKHWVHFILPAALLLLCLGKFLIDFLFFYPFAHTETYQYGTHGPWAQLDKADAIYLLSYGSVMFYILLLLRDFKQYEAYLIQHFSNPENINLRWLRNLLLFTAASLMMLFIFYAISTLFPRITYRFNWPPYFLLGIIIYYVSINGYNNGPGLFRNLHFELSAINKEAAISLPNLDEWKLRLANLMNSEKLHLDSELTLAKLAKNLGTSQQIVSKVINDGFGLNFNDYINKLRVETVIASFKNNAHQKFSLMGIAYDCGFNSKTTFNRAFKRVTGKTPSDYIINL